MSGWSPLLDAPAFPAEGYAGLADRLGAMLGTRNDLLLVQGEAIVALEAAAMGLARPGLSALNIVTSPYGAWFGQWLARGGAEVVDLVAEPGLPIALEAVEAALSAQRFDLVALVHAESATGILNPLPEIAARAKAGGALVVVDAVASFGGHALDLDALGIDLAVVGPQKALGGAAGVSAVAISPAAWDRIASPGAPERSTLSLLDLKRGWIDTGRGALPGMPSAIEFHALAAALARVEAEGFENLLARHALAARACRAGLAAIGVPAWVDASLASNLVTAAPLPEGLDPARMIAALAPFGAGIGRAVGVENLFRIDHTGQRARFAPVLAGIVAFGTALRAHGAPADSGAGAAAVAEIYGAGP